MDASPNGSAQIHILFTGYVRSAGDSEAVASTVAFIRDADVLAVIDPGMVPTQRSILDPLHDAGSDPEMVTDVILSHHHPDHTMNAGLFPKARVHDVWAIYQGDRWRSRPAEGFALSPSIRLIQTPGHTAADITTLVSTPDGITAFTHLWWSADGPEEDPLATDPAALQAGRRRVLSVATLIVPAHGAPFRP
ncbi:MAG TPA: MBL fold metallo-hydrolase [Candidatus Limnocylindrales bacterium]|nr:MBL fold metallo-hydrolase [Candidatus Limnocylindrales bacterium]